MITVYLVELGKDLKINLFWEKEEYKAWDRLVVQRDNYLTLLKYKAILIAEKTLTEADIDFWEVVEPQEVIEPKGETITEKPLIKMNKTELQEVCTSLGISFTDDIVKKDLIDLITAVEEEKA